MQHPTIAFLLGSILFGFYFVNYKTTESGIWVMFELAGVLLAAYILTSVFVMYILLPIASFLFFDGNREEVSGDINIDNVKVFNAYASIAVSFFLADFI